MNFAENPALLIAVMSVILFVAMGLDKWKAQKNRWRLSEKLLFTLALIGGATGGWIGMKVFHHKTKHWYFKYGFPILSILQIAACIYYMYFM